MKYFPLTRPEFAHQFGVRKLLPGEELIEVTDLYVDQIRQRRDQLAIRPEEYACFAEDDGASIEAARWVAITPGLFEAGCNARTGEPAPSSADSSGEQAFVEVAKHVQEDLVLLSPSANKGFPVLGGVVCFPSGWSIADKIGKSFLETHAPVPDFKRGLANPSTRLLFRLRPNQSVWRMNWGIQPSSRLDQSPRHLPKILELANAMTAERANQECYFRVERQTLTRLPTTCAILFTIHTHQCPLGQLSGDQRRIVLGNLQTMPAETLRYKGIEPMLPAVMEALSVAGSGGGETEK